MLLWLHCRRLHENKSKQIKSAVASLTKLSSSFKSQISKIMYFCCWNLVNLQENFDISTLKVQQREFLSNVCQIFANWAISWKCLVISGQSCRSSLSNLAKTLIFPFWNCQNPSFLIFDTLICAIFKKIWQEKSQFLWYELKTVDMTEKMLSNHITIAMTLQIFTNFMWNRQENSKFRVSEIAKNAILGPWKPQSTKCDIKFVKMCKVIAVAV